MGKHVRLNSAGSDVYTGGLDRSGNTDGRNFLFWEDRVTQVRDFFYIGNITNTPIIRWRIMWLRSCLTWKMISTSPTKNATSETIL